MVGRLVRVDPDPVDGLADAPDAILQVGLGLGPDPDLGLQPGDDGLGRLVQQQFQGLGVGRVGQGVAALAQVLLQGGEADPQQFIKSRPK